MASLHVICGLGPPPPSPIKNPGYAYAPITGYFHDKTKTSKQNLRVDYYLLPNAARDSAPYFLLYGPNH